MKAKGKRIKIILSLLIIIMLTIIFANQIFAKSDYTLEEVEYSEEYKQWLALSEEEKANTLEPRKYNISSNQTSNLRTTKNIFKLQSLLKGAMLTSFSLVDEIPENMVIRDQSTTNTCWAFAGLESLETNLALQDKKNGIEKATVYDFSELHMEYASTYSAFLNGKTNEKGLNRKLDDGGSFYMAEAYLTNGGGAVSESVLPFTTSLEQIDISKIQDSTAETTVYDTVSFEVPTTDDEKQSLITEMKSFISNYGGISAIISGATMFSNQYKNYNNETGALYTSDTSAALDHAIEIVGWDDNYEISNFLTTNQPSNPGAWLARFSWGTEITLETVENVKQIIFNQYEETLKQNGINSAEEILDENLIQYLEQIYGDDKVVIDGENVKIKIGDNGFVHISYDDINVYKFLNAVEKATATKDYLNIYQNDLLGPTKALTINLPDGENLYLANVFTRNSSESEYLNRISVSAFKGYTYKVYINANGDGMSLSELQEVELAEGSSVSCKSGYRSIEFAEPVKLTGDKFAVVLEVIDDDSEKLYLSIEAALDDDERYSTAIVNSKESYCTTTTGLKADTWTDLGASNYSGNLCIKAYTIAETEVEKLLESIEITEAPTKTVYQEGESFDKTGMKVVAKYTDGTTEEITDYTVTEGDNLTATTESVTISYTKNGITVSKEQAITVNKKETEKTTILKIEVEALPTKQEYVKDTDELDLKGGTIKVTYSDGTTKIIDMRDSAVNVTGFDNTTIGEVTLTVTYEEKVATFKVKIIEETAEKEKPVAADYTNAKATITEGGIYYTSNDLQNSIIKAKINVTSINPADNGTTYKFYYCLSGKKDKSNILEGDWQEATAEKQNDGTYLIIANIDTTDMAEDKLEEINNADNIYMHIKEVATLNEQNVTSINTFEVSSSLEDNIYLDGKVSSIDEILNKSKSNDNNNVDEDPTVATKDIPQTGFLPIAIGIVIIIGIAGFSLYRYRNIDK